mgnify:CR=1 FL=1
MNNHATSSLPYSFTAGFAPHAPTRSCPKGAENFQELKIFGHGTVLALTLSLSLRFFLKVHCFFVIIKLKEGGRNDFAILCNRICYRKAYQY